MRKKWIQSIKQKGTGTYFFDEYNLFKDITSKDDIIRFQHSNLTKLLMYAQEKVPYYHNLLENFDIITDGHINIENFQRIPLLTKGIIRSNQEDLVSRDFVNRKVHYNTSGGSTGEPVKFVQNSAYKKVEECDQLLLLQRYPGD